MRELIFKAHDGGIIKILYYPSPNQNRPLLVEIHGGGFVSNSAYTNEEMCRTLAERNNVNVASVDYRLAPKHVYPTATNDAVDALTFLVYNTALNFDRSKIVLLGESAGANIVAGVCHSCKSYAIKGQVLLYPYLDATKRKRKRVLMSFSNRQIHKMNDMYYPDKERRKEFFASPNLGSAEDYKALPAALVFTTGIDTVRCEGEEFVKRLRENGVSCTHIHYGKACHGYFEDVAKGAVDSYWWLSKKLKATQKKYYLKTMEEISDFLEIVFRQ